MFKNKTIKYLLVRIIKGSLPEPLFLFIKKQYYKLNSKLFLPANEPELNILKYLVEDGNYVIDIGANIGVYTKNLSELVGKSGKVIAMEPIPLTYKVLESNIKYYKLDNVIPFNLAVSDKDGFVRMLIPKSVNNIDNYYEAKITTDTTKKELFVVKTITIDMLSENIDHVVSFIKIDVEGHELMCLKGASKLLNKMRPILLIEVSENPDDHLSSAFELFTELNKIGYDAYWLNEGKFIKREKGILRLNYFFFTNHHINKIKENCHVVPFEIFL